MPTPRVDLFIDGAWVDVSSYVLYEEDGSAIEISRGIASESGSIEPQTAKLTFKNFDYRFTPKHPLSPYYGSLDRNTLIRIARDASKVNTSTYLFLAGDTADYASCPDSANLSITGDLDVRLELELDNWASGMELMGKWGGADPNPTQLSWEIILSSGELWFRWSTTGLDADVKSAISTDTIAADAGHIAIRVTMDVNNGAAGNDVKFYTSTDINGTWTQLGSTVTTSGTTSIFDSTAELSVGGVTTEKTGSSVGSPTKTAKIYAARVLQGIAGTVRASPDFSSQTVDTMSFTDGQGNLWTMQGESSIGSDAWRFHGEVSGWPVVSEITGRYITVPIEASGQWRRLSQNEQPVNSAMFRAHSNPALTRVKAYWSMEDGPESTQIASNLGQGIGYPMAISGAPTLSSYDEWTASASMPTMGTGRFIGRVFPYTATGESQVYAFVFVPDTGVAAETSLMRVETTGTVRTFDIRLSTTGQLITRAYQPDGTEIDDGAGALGSGFTFDMESRGFTILQLALEEVGTGLSWNTLINDFTNTDVIGGEIDTLAAGPSTITAAQAGASAATFGIIKSVIIGNNNGLADTHVSHLVVSNETGTFLSDVDEAVKAYNGESPSSRLLRICHEEEMRIIVVAKAQTGNSVSMGDQRADKTLTELLVEASDTDLGILHEARELSSLRYRTRLSLANQTPAVTLSHATHELADTLHPVDDDQLTVNQQYVIKDKGIKAFKSKTQGKLSVKPPKQGGVGPYTAEKTVSVTYDQQVDDQTGFRLFLGTRDTPRYPQIAVNLHHPSISGTSLEDDLLAADVGDRIVVTDLPAYLPPDDISVLMYGYTERFDQFRHSMVLNCRPEEPWQWAVADDTDKRADTLGSTTVSDFVSGTDTSMKVFTSDGPLWTLKAASWPFDIRSGGAQLTVTAVTPAISDDFSDTASSSWASPDVGPDAWTTSGGSTSDYNKTSGFGQVINPSTGVAHRVFVAAPSADFDIYVDIATNALATGASLFGGPCGRMTDNNNLYIARLDFNTSNQIVLTLRKRVASVETQLATFTTELTHVATTFYTVRFQGIGSALKAKVYLAGKSEPGVWSVSTTDTALSAAQNIGVRCFSNTGNTNVNPQIRFDNFKLVNPQILTITATPVNGVIKTIPSGSDVSVANPAYVGMW
jgi:hypothetical protein